MSNGICLQALWQVCLINTLPLLQLSSSFQTDCGWGTESPQSRTWLCTKYCWAAKRERHEQAEAACVSWDALRNCSMVTFCPLTVCNNYWFHCRNHLQKEKQPFFLPIDAKFSSNAFINHSMLYSKITGVMILMVLNICQGSLLTIKNPLISHWFLSKASFLTPLWITEDTENHPIFLPSCRDPRTFKQEFYLCSKSMAH